MNRKQDPVSRPDDTDRGSFFPNPRWADRQTAEQAAYRQVLRQHHHKQERSMMDWLDDK